MKYLGICNLVCEYNADLAPTSFSPSEETLFSKQAWDTAEMYPEQFLSWSRGHLSGSVVQRCCIRSLLWNIVA